MILSGKISFITGSTRGIGWSTARLFASEGATVILNGREAGTVEAKAKELRNEFAGATVMAIAADACDAAQVKSAYAAIFKQFKRLDVLVNNAGVLIDGLLGMIPDTTIRTVVDTNLVGPIIHLQEASRLMTRHRAGSIVNISSIIGRYGNEGQTVYTASKAAVIGLTLAAAKELAPKGVRVNAIAPGFIDTQMTHQLPQDKFQLRLSGIRMGRIGAPEEVAEAILFLASDKSSYITGQVLGVDGGMVV